MPNSYLDEFKKTYERPQVDGLIVGFSGIDPQKKKETVSLSNEQQEIIKQLILGEISTEAGCKCDNSILSDEQKNIVNNIVNNKILRLIFNIDSGDLDNITPTDDNDDETSDDNPSSGNETSGGNTGNNDSSSFDDEPIIPPAETLANINPALIDHEIINNLLGGNSNGHYHVTHDELKYLRLLIASFFPYSGSPSDGSSGSGTSGGGSSTTDPFAMIMPASVITPVAPVTPVTPADAVPTNPDDLANYDPHFGMPSGTPPAWEILPFPNGYTADSGYNKIYYGGTVVNPKKNILVVFVDKKGKDDYIEAVITSDDAKSWVTTNKEKIPFSTTMKTVYDLFFDKNYNYMYALYEPTSTATKAANMRYRYASATDAFYSVEKAISMCWAEPLNALLVVGKTGAATLLKYKTASAKRLTVSTIHNVGMPVNPRGAAWHPKNDVLCVCGQNGTAVSSDGQNWFVNHDAPKNMTGLFYREDKEAFFAYSLDDKLFYYSNDGGVWSKAGNAPIPFDTITAVDFNPVNQVFCAAGLGDKGAYFSKDLNHWTFAGIRNTTTDIASLISLPDKGLYVAIPTSGAYYYTFDYNNWQDVSAD